MNAGQRKITLFVAIGLLGVSLMGCGRGDPEKEEPRQTQPPATQTTPAPTPTSTAPQATPLPMPSETAPDLTPLQQAGSLESGHTLRLQGGKWYDSQALAKVQSQDRITIESTGTGRPTLSRPDQDAPILTLEDSRQIVFRGIRFGHPGQDFAEALQPGDVPLLKILGSESIRFENCEFFGGTQSAVFVAASENIVFENCQFYDLAGVPLQTDLQDLPSQMSFSDCTFETRDSGLMPLHVRDTTFTDCTFLGQDGYRIPVLATACELSTQHAADLHEDLKGILAARIPFHRDAYQALTLRQTVFCSEDVYGLFARLEAVCEQTLPRRFSKVALAGEKDGEQDPGRRLDPTLGVRLELRSEVGGQETYDLTQLEDDLAPLADLPEALRRSFDGLFDGDLQLQVRDAEDEPLMDLALRLGDIEPLLASFDLETLLELGNVWLMRPQALPQDFSDPSLGAITGYDSQRLLADSWQTETGGFALSREAQGKPPVFIEPHLRHRGTRLQEGGAAHVFRLEVTRSVSYDQPDCLFVLPVSEFEVHAADGSRQDRVNPRLLGERFRLPDDAARQALAEALSSPLQEVVSAVQAAERELFNLEAGDALSLRLLSLQEPRAEKTSPILVFDQNDDSMTLRTVLYDEMDSPWLVELHLRLGPDGWQVATSQILA